MHKIQFDITSECNLSCEICYLVSEPAELLPETIKTQVESHSQSTTIALGGGEPFLHNKLENIINSILSHGNNIHLSTNASFIPGWFYQIASKDREKIVVQTSLLASTRETYTEICGKDYLPNVIQNTTKLKDYYSTIVHSCVYKKNRDEVKGIIDICQNIGVPLQVDLVMPIGKGKNVALLDADDIQNLQDLLLPYVALGSVTTRIIDDNCKCPMLAAYYPFKFSSDGNCPALSGNSLYFNPQGEAQKCVFRGGQENDRK